MDDWFQRQLAKRKSQTIADSSSTPTNSPPMITPMALSPALPEAEGGSAFDIEVQLSGEVLGFLRFSKDDRIDAACNAFITDHRLRDIFRQPLISHVESMAERDECSFKVDIIDII